MLGCKGTETDVTPGSITVTYLPSDYTFLNAKVFTDETHSTILGISSRNPSIRDQLMIFDAMYDERDNRFYTTSDEFTFSGSATVDLQLSNVPDPRPWDILYLSFHDVVFSDGHTTIDTQGSFFSLPETDGKFTLTDIPAELNGTYAIMYGVIDANRIVYGFDDADSVAAFRGFEVVGGRVDIPVYSFTVGDTMFEGYSGDDKLMALTVIFVPTPDYDWQNYNPNDIQGLVYTSDSTFQSGQMNKAFDDTYWVGRPLE